MGMENLTSKCILSEGKNNVTEENLRSFFCKPQKINKKYNELKNMIYHLKNTSANLDSQIAKKGILNDEELNYRTQIAELLNSKICSNLSPRQLTILHLHYLEYQSWNDISSTLNIERRYAIQIHKNAINRILDNISS